MDENNEQWLYRFVLTMSKSLYISGGYVNAIDKTGGEEIGYWNQYVVIL